MTTETSWTSVSSSHLLFLKIIGLIPYDGKTWDSLATRFFSFLAHLMNLTYNGMWTGYGVRVYPKIFEVGYMCEIIVVQGGCFRYLVFYLYRVKISKLVNTCRELWSRLRDSEGQVVRIFERKAYYFRTFLFIDNLALSSVFIASTILIEIPAAAARNETKQLIFRYWKEGPGEPEYSLVTAWQLILAYYIPLEGAGLETVGLFLIMMASGYLRVIQERLNRLNDKNMVSDNALYDEVLECVKYHQEIMRFCKDIEVVTSKAFFVVVLTSSYNLSIIGINLLDHNDYAGISKYTTLLLLNLFQFFAAQYGPEHLMTESEAIGNAAYFATLRQSHFEKRTNKMLLFIMMRAQRPIQLTAGGLINLSMETFGRMLRSAFSFFALLRSLHE